MSLISIQIYLPSYPDMVFFTSLNVFDSEQNDTRMGGERWVIVHLLLT